LRTSGSGVCDQPRQQRSGLRDAAVAERKHGDPAALRITGSNRFRKLVEIDKVLEQIRHQGAALSSVP
jgi:hypothetical protein